MKQKVIIVLGMHRSGTSVLTSGLSSLGIDAVTDNRYTSEENPKGYFEDWDVVELNDLILEDLGVSWANPFIGKISINDIDQGKYLPRITEILNKNYEDKIHWVLKDPRMCLLHPIWYQAIKNTLKHDVYYLHIFRNPLEVAYSLKRRREKSKMFYCGDIQQSLLLWFTYYQNSLGNVPHDNNIFISFENIIRTPKIVLENIARLLQISPDDEQLKIFTKKFIEKDLKHHSLTLNDLQSSSSNLQFIIDFYTNLDQMDQSSLIGRPAISTLLDTLPDLHDLHTLSNVCSNIFQEMSLNNDHLYFITKQIEKQLDDPSFNENELMSLPDIYGLWQSQVSELNNTILNSSFEIERLSNDLYFRDSVFIQLTHKLNRTSKLHSIPLVGKIFHKIEKLLDKKRLTYEHTLIKESSLFDEDFYRHRYLNNQKHTIDPIRHYLTEGYLNAAKPNAYFDYLAYYEENPLAIHSKLNPFAHYIKYRSNKEST